MSNKVLFIYQAIDKYSAVGRAIAKATNDIRASFTSAQSAVKRYSDKLNESAKITRKFGKSMSDVGGAMTAKITLPLAAIGTAALIQSAKMETLNVSFETMLGSAEKGKKLMAELVAFSASTPFELPGIAKASKMLLGFGVQAKDQVKTLTQIGDVAAGVSTPLGELGLIYGQVLAKGKFQGEELLQLAERGIPIVAELVKLSGKSKEEIQELASKGQITAKDFQVAFASMSKEGGMFFNMMAKQSKTMSGLFSTLKDNIGLTTSDLGTFLTEQFKLKDILADIITKVGDFRKRFKVFTENHPKLAKLIVILAGLLAILGPILLIIGQLIIAFAALQFALAFLGTTFAAISLPILAVLALMALMATSAVMVITNWEDMVGGFKLLMTDVSEYWSRTWDTMINKVKSFILDIRIKFQEIKNSFKEFKDGALDVLSFGGSFDIFGSSKTDINVNLNAPKGAISSVQSTSSGKGPNMNIGLNMVTQ